MEIKNANANANVVICPAAPGGSTGGKRNFSLLMNTGNRFKHSSPTLSLPLFHPSLPHSLPPPLSLLLSSSPPLTQLSQVFLRRSQQFTSTFTSAVFRSLPSDLITFTNRHANANVT